MAQVSLDHVSKVYEGGVTAVHDASFEVANREFMVLVGPSGCGKSTLLRMVAGLEDVSGGIIRIDGKVVNDIPPRERDIALVFQNYALYPHMSVYDNMSLGLRIRKIPKAEIDRSVRGAAKTLGITELLQRKPGQLSGGQRQRVAVGRAIVRRPRVFLFDEPLSNLDPDMRTEMRTEISRLHHHLGATMIYVTHDQVEAMTMGTRIAVVNKGEIQQVATPMELYDRPTNRFVAGFVGTPRMNFWTAAIHLEEGGFLELGGQRLAIEGEIPASVAELTGRELVLGLRPEDVPLAKESNQGGFSAQLSTTIDVLEPLGSETLLYWNFAGKTSISRVTPDAPVAVDQEIPLRLLLDKAQFFDAQSGEALLSHPA